MLLTQRQYEIFELLGQGHNSREIGQRLTLSPKTVDAHKANLMLRLRFTSTRETLVAAVKWSMKGGAK